MSASRDRPPGAPGTVDGLRLPRIRLQDAALAALAPVQPPAAESDAPGPMPALVAPAPPAVVLPADAEGDVRVAADVEARVLRLVDGFIKRLAATDVHDEGFGRLEAELARIGEREVVATSQMSARLVERPVRAIGGFLVRKAPVARSLAELREIVEDMEAHAADGSPDRYARAQGRVRVIASRLDTQKAELLRDLAEVDQERRSLWLELVSLRNHAHLAARLDEALERHIEDVEGADPGRARVLRTDLQLAVRQRRRDLLTHLAVATQGLAALQVIGHNDREIVRAIQAATTTTIAALQTAVAVARATTARRLLDRQLRTAREPRRTPRDGPRRGIDHEAEGSDGTVDVVALRQAWGGVISTLDQIDRYVLEAAVALRATAFDLGTAAVRSGAGVAASLPAEPDEPDDAQPARSEGVQIDER